MRKKLNLKSKDLRYAALVVSVVLSLFLVSTLVPLTSVDASSALWRPKARTTITLTLDASNSYIVNSNVNIDGALKSLIGVPGATLTLKIIGPDGSIDYPSQGSTTVTDRKGRFSVDYVPTDAGQYQLKVTFAGDKKYASSYRTTIFQISEPEVSVRWTWLQLPDALTMGDSGTCSAKLEITSGSGAYESLEGVEIAFTFTDEDGIATVEKAITDNSGVSSVSFTPNAAGEWTVSCSCHISGVAFEMEEASSRSVTVSEAEFPTPEPIPEPIPEPTPEPIPEPTPEPIPEPEPTPTTPTYDLMVSSSVVKNALGNIEYSGSSFTSALDWAVGQTGKIVYVPSGTYDVNAVIGPFASGVTLMGDGPGLTEFRFALGGTSTGFFTLGFNPVNVNNVVLKQFGITGNGAICFTTSSGTTTNNVVEDVRIHDTAGAQLTTFGVIVSNGCTASGYKFVRCVAYNVGGDGFDLWGTETSWDSATVKSNAGWLRNFYFEDCKAMWCGYTARYWDWTPGWDIGERCNVDNIKFLRCEASYSWESGFHVEGIGYYTNILLQDCVANHNGQKWSDPRGAAYGRGCNGDSHVKVINFQGVGNANGLGPDWPPAYDYSGVPTYYTYTLSSNVVKDANGNTVYTGSSFSAALQWAVSKTNARVYVPTGTYTVTGTISLANGVTLYGVNPQQNYNPARHTVFVFSGSTGTEGFLVKDVNNVRLFNFEVKYGHIEWMASPGITMTGNMAKGITVYQTTNAHSFAVGTYCSDGSTISGLTLGAVVVTGSQVEEFKFITVGTGKMTGLVMNLCIPAAG